MSETRYSIENFIADCEQLLKRSAVTKNEVVGAHLRSAAQVFESPGLL